MLQHPSVLSKFQDLSLRWKKPEGLMPPDVHQRYSEHFFPSRGDNMPREKVQEVYNARYLMMFTD